MLHSDAYGLEDEGMEMQTGIAEVKPDSKKWNKLIGFVCIALTVASWVAMAVLLQKLQNGQPDEKKFDKAFFIDYAIHAGYSLTLFPWAIWRFVISSEPIQRQEIDKRIIVWSFALAVVVGVAGYTWYLSLPETSVSANTAIYNSSCTIVFLISVFALGEDVTLYKVLSVALCVGGVIVISIFGHKPSDSGEEKNTPFGYIMVIASTVSFAVYEVCYGVYTQKRATSISNSLLFLGLIGVWTALFAWPIFFILHYTGFETFELPYGNNLWGLVENMALDIVLNASLLIGVQITSPLFISLGSLLAMPASILADKFAYDYVLPWPAFLGILLVVVGFLGLNLAEEIAFLKNTKWRAKWVGRKFVVGDKTHNKQWNEEKEDLIGEGSGGF